MVAELRQVLQAELENLFDKFQEENLKIEHTLEISIEQLILLGVVRLGDRTRLKECGKKQQQENNNTADAAAVTAACRPRPSTIYDLQNRASLRRINYDETFFMN